MAVAARAPKRIITWFTAKSRVITTTTTTRKKTRILILLCALVLTTLTTLLTAIHNSSLSSLSQPTPSSDLPVFLGPNTDTAVLLQPTRAAATTTTTLSSSSFSLKNSSSCLLRITHAQGKSREYVCPRLNSSALYGEPFSVGDGDYHHDQSRNNNKCKNLAKALYYNLTAGCRHSGKNAVQLQTATLPSIIPPQCYNNDPANNNLFFAPLPPKWAHYQFNDKTLRICGVRPWSCFGANHTTPPQHLTVNTTTAADYPKKCLYESIHIPVDSLAAAVGERCRLLWKQQQQQEQQLRQYKNETGAFSFWPPKKWLRRKQKPLTTAGDIWFTSMVQVLREEQAKQLVVAAGKNNNNNNKIPAPHDIVIHLRLGDVVDGSAFSVQELLTRARPYYPASNGSVYVYPAQHYQDVIVPTKLLLLSSLLRQQQQQQSTTTIYLVAGAHGGWQPNHSVPSTTKSCAYVLHLRDYLLRLGAARVELRLGGLPDEDLLFMARARYFVPGGGGFSRTVSWLVQELGGTVLGGAVEKQDDEIFQ